MPLLYVPPESATLTSGTAFVTVSVLVVAAEANVPSLTYEKLIVYGEPTTVRPAVLLNVVEKPPVGADGGLLHIAVERHRDGFGRRDFRSVGQRPGDRHARGAVR